MQVTVNNSPILDYSHLNDHIQTTYEITSGFNNSQDRNNAIGVVFKLI